MVVWLSQACVLVFVFPVALAGLLCVCWAVFMQVVFKNSTDLVSSVTSQEFVLSLNAGVRFASDTWAARRSFGVIKGFRHFIVKWSFSVSWDSTIQTWRSQTGLAYIPLLVMLAAGTALCGKQCLAVWSSMQ